MDVTAIRAFRRVIREFEQLTSRQSKTCCTGVTLAQCHALLELGAQGESTTLRLAKRLRLEKSTVSLTIDALVKLGLVRRSPHPTDRRIVLLTLTSEGRARCDAINKANDEYYTEIFKRIPRESQSAVIENFTLLVQAFANHAGQRESDATCCDSATRRRVKSQ